MFTEFSHFELQFGRKPNTELSTDAEYLPSRVNLENQQLERDLLRAEKRQEQCDRRPRVKVMGRKSLGETILRLVFNHLIQVFQASRSPRPKGRETRSSGN